ncbi:hypothetical protein J5J83_02150 [Azoarcus sp. L1K30]|uniref:hypothetical protein n=1 Tax=Azoarcus sp. L1K30 TaxID=2820277 RepID=UPI001B829E6F|nr:hypothetical protein [Azoarcus sp. L1K30]MBR0564916.1 hypothetical protein [Azoarcus sp. L1K30]
MSQTDRIVTIRRLFSERRLVSRSTLLDTLEVSYDDHRELMMDVLKRGRHCEVLGPEGLRVQVAEEITCWAENLGHIRGCRLTP